MLSLLNTKGQYMKKSSTLVNNVAKNFLQKKMLCDTNGQYMKESNTLAVNAVNNFPGRIHLQDLLKACSKLFESLLKNY